MKVTARSLKKLGACADQVTLFRRTFPRGCEPTEANLLKAYEIGLNMYWWTFMVLPAPAWAAHREATAPALAAHRAATAAALAAYEEATAAAWAVYLEALAAALARIIMEAGL